MALPPPRFDCRPTSSGNPTPMNPFFGGSGPMRQNLPPRPRFSRPQPNGLPPFFLRPRVPRGMVPVTMSPMVSCGVKVPRPPVMRHYLRIVPPQMMPPMRPRFMINNGNVKDNMKVNKLETHSQPDDKRAHNQRDKSDVASEDNTSHYCGICDRDFLSEDALTEHNNTHKLCGIDGCTFSAHPLLVEKHISMQHSTGLYARMKILSEEEGAKKWTEERKKRFPTKNNIKLREAENLEKVQRGETIKQNRHVFKTMRTTYGKKRKSHKRLARKTDDCPHASELYRGLRPFPGIDIYLKEENSSKVCLKEETEQIDSHKEIADDISDEDDDTPKEHVKSESNLSIPSLVANYGSEEEDDLPEEVPIKKEKMEDQDHKILENITVPKEASNDVLPMISCTNANEDKSNHQIIDNETSQHFVNKRQNKQKHKTNQTVEDKKHEKVSIRHRSTLLHMLLARSIQHERNLISQCLKYIVDNNFFESSRSGT